jgi:hypothetical protein
VLTLGLGIAIGFGLTVGLTVALTSGLMGGLPVGLGVGVVGGLTAALTIGLVCAPASARYFCASLLMASQGLFPRRAAVFLEWAHQAGLLRVTGAVYQFRHDTYRRWLIAREGD